MDESLDRLGEAKDVTPHWYNAAIPIACVIGFTMLGLYATGLEGLSADQRSAARLSDIIGQADAYKALLWAAIGASIVAALLAVVHGQRTAEVISSWVRGVKSLTLAVMILLLAWSISSVCIEIHTADYVASITQDLLSARLVPALAFLTAGVIAFSTGTSYGTMGILIPIFLPLAYRLAATAELVDPLVDRIGLATLAAVLGGSVFGDHCSPISDTTVLSSMASGADHIDHVRTQLPYALLAAVICLPCYLLIGLGLPVPVVLGGGAIALVGLFRFLAKR